jgi:integrase
MVRDGLDPLEQRRLARRRTITFRMAAEQCWEERKSGFKNSKHRDQWINTLRTYAYPKIGEIPVSDLQHHEVRDALKPIWLTKKETARRVLQRIADTCSWAIGSGLRDAELPKKVIRDSLGKQKIKVRHFPAVPIEDAPRVYAGLKKDGSRAAEALRFQILTVLRPGIGRAALWPEVDLEHGLWTIPAERMKTDEEHVVPLSDGAIDILHLVKAIPTADEEGTPFVFPSPMKPTKAAISDTSLKKAQAKIIDGVTLHGWRSTFEDWAAEYTSFDESIIDAAMAHALDDEVKAAYRRTLFLDQRLELMTQWEDFLEGRVEIRQGLDAAHRANKRKVA